MDNKTDYRLYSKKLRENIDIEKCSMILVDKIREFPLYKSARNVMIFYPKSKEIDLRELFNDNKNFYLPKVCGEDLLVCPYCGDLKCSDLNIMEPCSEPVNPNIIDLIIVPALLADSQNYRLGYGGGYYDRFFAKFPNLVKVVALPEKFVVEKLPTDDYDVKMDFIITC